MLRQTFGWGRLRKGRLLTLWGGDCCRISSSCNRPFSLTDLNSNRWSCVQCLAMASNRWSTWIFGEVVIKLSEKGFYGRGCISKHKKSRTCVCPCFVPINYHWVMKISLVFIPLFGPLKPTLSMNTTGCPMCLWTWVGLT